MILIKDMGMPESCFDCPIEYDCMCCSITGKGFWTNDDPIDYYKTRMQDCPLVEVEPYGIDGLLYKEK